MLVFGLFFWDDENMAKIRSLRLIEYESSLNLNAIIDVLKISSNAMSKFKF